MIEQQINFDPAVEQLDDAPATDATTDDAFDGLHDEGDDDFNEERVVVKQPESFTYTTIGDRKFRTSSVLLTDLDDAVGYAQTGSKGPWTKYTNKIEWRNSSGTTVTDSIESRGLQGFDAVEMTEKGIACLLREEFVTRKNDTVNGMAGSQVWKPYQLKPARRKLSTKREMSFEDKIRILSEMQEKTGVSLQFTL